MARGAPRTMIGGRAAAVEGVTDAEIGKVARYVRALRQANGVF